MRISYAHYWQAAGGAMAPDIRRPRKSRKKAVNVTVDAELLARARAVDINLSGVVEQALADAVREAGRARWLEQNREALADYNRYVERHGVFADDLRGF